MTFKEYFSDFEKVVNTPVDEQVAPYDNPDYIDYTKLNWSRMNRWLKKNQLTEEFKNVIQQIDTPQQWIVITEPWCGDAAHSVPFIELASRQNPLIKVSYELRDSEPFRINEYLTNGSKSIPKLIVRDAEGKDLGTWGPRPKACQDIYERLTAENADFERTKTEIQHWYNSNKGEDIQAELSALFRSFK
ncbi:thioredoxin family protein [Albibacterium profundi]|uniref:Thioredoxin family protein n=1 Tax=Albibacterium profundi TaxID=3134906 RepID=A0ABV5CFP2_9SPHI